MPIGQSSPTWTILKVYTGAPHGLASTHQDQLNQDLLYFAP
jgi:non-heme chloroperoxidase